MSYHFTSNPMNEETNFITVWILSFERRTYVVATIGEKLKIRELKIDHCFGSVNGRAFIFVGVSRIPLCMLLITFSITDIQSYHLKLACYINKI